MPGTLFHGVADRLVEVPEGGEKEEVLSLAREAALRETVRLAQEICDGAPVAIRASWEAAMWAREYKENRMSERVVIMEDRNEALKAFAERRKLVFKGR